MKRRKNLSTPLTMTGGTMFPGRSRSASSSTWEPKRIIVLFPPGEPGDVSYAVTHKAPTVCVLICGFGF